MNNTGFTREVLKARGRTKTIPPKYDISPAKNRPLPYTPREISHFVESAMNGQLNPDYLKIYDKSKTLTPEAVRTRLNQIRKDTGITDLAETIRRTRSQAERLSIPEEAIVTWQAVMILRYYSTRTHD